MSVERRAAGALAASLAMLIVASSGCPAPRPPAPSGPPVAAPPIAGDSRGRPPAAPLTPRPAMRRPPFSIALSCSGPTTLCTRVCERLRRALRLSAVFVITDRADPTDEPGGARLSAHTQVRFRLRHERDRLEASVTITLPGAGTSGATAKRTVRARQPRRLALHLAEAIHRHHLDTPGPFLSQIAFVARASRRSRQLLVIDFDGAGLRRVSQTATLDILPAWSRAGDLVYTSYAAGSPQLVVVPATGAPQRRLRSFGGLNSGASFSPDGRRIAVTVSRGGNTDIYVVGRDGALLERLTRHRALDLSPAWSPDGQQIAFVSDRAGSPQIYLLQLGGTRPRRVTFSGGYNQEPAWCPLPGSNRLAYTRRYAGERYAIHVIDFDRGTTARLTPTSAVSKRPSWSPDCRLLVFARDGGLWIVTADGRQQTRLHGTAASTPAWSPVLARLPASE